MLFDSAVAADPAAALAEARSRTKSQPSYKNPDETAKQSSLCLSLLPLFNFSGTSRVTYAEWQRGTQSLGLSHLSKDASAWTEMTLLYGDGASISDQTLATVDLEQVSFLVPLEPHVQSLMRAFVFAIDHVKTFAATQLRKQVKQTEMKASGLILRKRREILQPPLAAWSAFTRKERTNRRRGRKLLARVFMREVSFAFYSWAADARGMRRAGKFMRRLMQRDIVKAMGSWREYIHSQRRARKALRRILHANLGRALNAWLAQGDTYRRLRKFGRRLQSREFLRGWNAWIEFGTEWMRRRHQQGRAASRLGKPRLSAAWNTWMATVQVVDRGTRPREAHAPEKLEEAPLTSGFRVSHFTGRMSKYARSFIHRELRRTYETWLDFWGKRRRLQRFGKRLMSHQMGRAWNTWSLLFLKHETVRGSLSTELLFDHWGSLATQLLLDHWGCLFDSFHVTDRLLPIVSFSLHPSCFMRSASVLHA